MCGLYGQFLMSDKKNTRIALLALFGVDFGARSISAFLKKHGYPVSLLFFNKKGYSLGMVSSNYFNVDVMPHHVCDKKNLDLLIGLLKKIDAKIVGVSLTATTFQTAKAITLEIKKRLDVTVVWGGVHAIVCPEECIRYADIVCLGEGETPMLELAEKIEKNEPVTGIANLWIKTGDSIEKNEMAPLIADLDTLPFPDFADRGDKFLIYRGKIIEEYSISSAHEIYSYPIMTSRGCMYACSFCSNSILKRRYEGKGGYLRRRSVENVIAELKYAAASRQFNRVRFWDDIFTYDAQWINEFCERYIREVGKRFTCYTHPSRTEKNILLKLRGAGLCVVNMGIQSGSEEMSKRLFSRPQSNRDLLDFARFADNIGVTIRYDVISDNPYETDRDEESTAELLMQLPYPFQIQHYSLCWFPETPLTKKALEDGTITRGDLEQNTSKSLDNFYMYIVLSRDTRSFFWNCIKGMAVNRLFPVSVIRACIKSRFLKRYPRLMFAAGKCYLALRAHYGLALRKRGFALEKKVPLNVARMVLQMDRQLVDSNVITGDARCLFQNPASDYSLFPLAGEAGRKICLRIRNHDPAVKFFDFNIVLVAHDDYFQSSPAKAMWVMRIDTGDARETDVRADLDYPRFAYTAGDNKGTARLLEQAIPALVGGKLYALVVRSAVRPYTIIDTLLFKA